MSRRVLVADDSTTIQKVIKIAFSRHELEIVEAASLIEALTSVGRAPIDALILDASLPGARSPSDFAKLRADAGGVPALLLVGTYDAVDEGAFRQAGFTHFLKKPFESSDIVSTVDSLLGGASREMAPEAPPPPPLGRPQHPTMIVTGGFGGLDPTRPPPAASTKAPVPPAAPAPSMSFSGSSPHLSPTTSPSLSLGDEDTDDGDGPRLAPPPPPALDQARKGRRAFSEGEDTSPSRAPGATGEETDPRRSTYRDKGLGGMAPPLPLPGPSPAVPKVHDQAQFQGQIQAGVLAALEEQLPGLVRQAVEDYCDRHFKSLARDIIATELRRLADEKARHLVDN